MKSFSFKITSALALAAVSFLLASCGDFKKSSVVNPPSNGSADFSMYVSLGNSLTAGYQNGALYESAQQYSYPADIAQQAGVSASAFQQPLISEPGIGGRLKILSLAGPVIGRDPAGAGVPMNLTLARPYNNLGVPGAVLYDLIDTSSFAAKAGPPRNNPFFSIVLRNPALGKSPVMQALALHPTFMTVWIGANDVLGYATSGGTIGTDPATHSLPTDIPTFTYLYNTMMGALLAGDSTAKFAVANIPDVTSIPFFTTIPAVVVNPLTNQVVINPQTGQPVPLIVMRHEHGNLVPDFANPKYDLILLTALDSLKAGVGIPTQLGGTGRPLGTQFVLDSSEVATTEQAIQGFNQVIGAFAAGHSNRVALVDAYSTFNDFAKYGYVGQGVDLTNSYITGGFFGLDGVHPTSQGYAYVANIFIQAINQRFGANIPLVSISTTPSSIVLGKRGAAKILWPNIHYSDLKPVLQLFQQSDLSQ